MHGGDGKQLYWENPLLFSLWWYLFEQSSHNPNDTQLDTENCVKTETAKSAPTPWLPVLSDKAPPYIRLTNVHLCQWQESINETLQIFREILIHRQPRFKYRKPHEKSWRNITYLQISKWCRMTERMVELCALKNL